MTRKFLTLLCLLPLGACSLWLDYTQPETPAPQAWQGPVAPQAAVWPDAKWWDNFKSPELTALMAQAQEANFDIKAAVARIRQADAQRRIAGASLLPSADLSLNTSRSQQSTSARTVITNSTGTSSGGGQRIFNAFNGSAGASYELDFWGKNSAAAAAADATLAANQYDAETVRLTTQASVANTYFDMVATQARLATAHQNQKNAQEVLDALKLREKVGVSTALEVAQQETVAATQDAAVAPLELRLRQDQDAMAILLGKLPAEVKLPATALKDIAVPQVAPGLPSELLLRRPDVQFAEAQLIAADANIVNARAQFFPSISLTSQAGYTSRQLNQFIQPQSFIWSIGSSLAQPIFDGGALFGNLDLNKARYDELLETYRKAAIASYSDVEDALAAVAYNAAQEKSQQQAVDAARRAFTYAQQQFKGGIIDITTVLDTQRSLFSAEDTLLQLRLLNLQAAVGLYNALGGGWKKPDVK